MHRCRSNELWETSALCKIRQLWVLITSHIMRMCLQMLRLQYYPMSAHTCEPQTILELPFGDRYMLDCARTLRCVHSWTEKQIPVLLHFSCEIFIMQPISRAMLQSVYQNQYLQFRKWRRSIPLDSWPGKIMQSHTHLVQLFHGPCHWCTTPCCTVD